MNRTLAGIFPDRNEAEAAAHEVRELGLNIEDISIVTRHGEIDINHEERSQITNDNISDGVTAGGILGGLAGLLLGAGTFAVPGLGIIAGAGPLIGLLTGAVGGGLIGGLIDLGIPEEQGKRYEEDVKGGKVLFTMHGEEDVLKQVEDILKNHNAQNVNIY